MPTTAEILKKVRRLEIRTKRVVTEALAGAYHSVFRGQGLNFEEVRAYAPGDDIRAIDWNVTARQDEPYIKIFREEREQTLMLLVDMSGSGDYGSIEESKRERAAEVASVLAFSAIRNQDKVGLLLFTDRIEKYIPPQKGRQHVLRVIRDILFFEPEGRGTDLELAIRTASRLLKRHAVTFLVSDFLVPDVLTLADRSERGPVVSAWTTTPTVASTTRDLPLFGALRRLSRRHDTIAVVLSDPRETELPNAGLVLLEDAETGTVLQVDTGSAELREAYLETNRRRRESLTRALRQSRVDVLEISTAADYEKPLQAFFRARLKRR